MNSFLFFIVLFLAIPIFHHAEARIWTATDGRTLEGEMVGFENATVKIRRADGRAFPIPLDTLSDAARAFVQITSAREKTDAARLTGLDDGPYATAVQGEWIVFPKTDTTLPFNLFLGKELRRKKDGTLFPLFIHLHGASSRAGTAEAGKVEIAAQRLAREDQYKETPSILCVPVCPPDSYWSDHVSALEAMIDDLCGHLPVDRNRIYLSGYSMGSHGIQALLKSRPDFYAAALLADGPDNPAFPDDTTTALWLCYSGERKSETLPALAERFQAKSIPFHHDIFPDQTHNQIHWKLAHDENVFPWLFQRTKAAP